MTNRAPQVSGGARFVQRDEKLFRHADGLLRKAPKTSNSHSSAYTGTVECELRSKRFDCFRI